MQNRLTAKLFHTVVVLGVGMTCGACSDETPETPTPAKTASSSASSSGALADGGGPTTNPSSSTSSTSSSGSDSFAGWVCCG